MKKVETGIKDLYVLEPRVFGDERGWFQESYNKDTFKILYNCETCNQNHKNIMASDDDMDLIIMLSYNKN